MDNPDLVSELTEEEGMIRERHQMLVAASPETTFAVVKRIGGDTGWLYANRLWKIRGLLDMMMGGVGLRRTRRSYSKLRVGDAVDFWRVEAINEGDENLLRLRAEMKVPGKAWLQFEAVPDGDGTCLTQTAFYEPKGLFGFLYWWLFYPAHWFIFPGMIREVARRAEASEVRQDQTATLLR